MARTMFMMLDMWRAFKMGREETSFEHKNVLDFLKEYDRRYPKKSDDEVTQNLKNALEQLNKE